jgi:prophage regulatory protein
MTEKPRRNRRLISLKTVQGRTGLKHTTIYKGVALGTFPQPVQISSRCTRWYEDEVDDWIAALPRGVGSRPGSAAKRAPEASAA